MPGPSSLEYQEFLELMKQTTENLKKMTAAAEAMRWQGINEEAFNAFQTELYNAQSGWVSSNC